MSHFSKATNTIEVISFCIIDRKLTLQESFENDLDDFYMGKLEKLLILNRLTVDVLDVAYVSQMVSLTFNIKFVKFLTIFRTKRRRN